MYGASTLSAATVGFASGVDVASAPAAGTPHITTPASVLTANLLPSCAHIKLAVLSFASVRSSWPVRGSHSSTFLFCCVPAACKDVEASNRQSGDISQDVPQSAPAF